MEIPADRLSPCDQRLRKVNKIIAIFFIVCHTQRFRPVIDAYSSEVKG